MLPAALTIDIFRGDDVRIVFKLFAVIDGVTQPLDPTGSTFELTLGNGELKSSALANDRLTLVHDNDRTELVWEATPAETRRIGLGLITTYRLARIDDFYGRRTYLTGILRGIDAPKPASGDTAVSLTVDNSAIEVAITVDDSVAPQLADRLADLVAEDRAAIEAVGEQVDGDATAVEAARQQVSANAAQVASDKDAAAGSATASANSAGDAQTSATNAASARTSAQAARDVAQTAQAGAEAASTAAQTARDSAVGAAANQTAFYDTKSALDANTTAVVGVVRSGIDVGTYERSTPGNPATPWVKTSIENIFSLAARYVADRVSFGGRVAQPLNSGADEGGSTIVYPIIGQNGRMPLGFKADGSTEFTKLTVARRGRARVADDGIFMLSVNDVFDKVAGGWMGDGSFYAVPSIAMSAQLSRRLATDPANATRFPLAARARSARFNPDKTIGGVIATITEGDPDVGMYGVEVVQPSNERAPLGGFISTSATASQIHLVYGQSNAGRQPGEAWQGSPFASHILQFPIMRAISAPSAFQDTNQRDIAPLADTDGPYLQTLVLNRLHWDRLRAGSPVTHLFGCCAYQGGQPLDQFVSGTQNHLNAESEITRAAVLYARFGKTPSLAAILWVQGEAGPTGYNSLLSAHIDETRASFAAANVAGGGTAGTPHFFILGTNTSATIVTATDEDVRQAQYDVAMARLGAGVTHCGPAYQGAFIDGIHSALLARMAISDAVGHVHHLVLDRGLTFAPLRITGAVLSGSTITATLALPLETTKISVDTDWVPAIQNYGFVFTDDSGATPAIIGSPILNNPQFGTSAPTITFQLASPPTGTVGSRKLRYAFDNLSQVSNGSDPGGWAAGRGQIMAETAIPSLWHRKGYAVPKFIRHYLVPQIVPLTLAP